MKEYQKISTLYKFDGVTKKYTNEISSPEVDYLKDLPWLAAEKIDGCVSSRTRIIMADGTSKYMKDIKEGDLVWGYDIESKQAKIVSVQATSHKSRAGKWFIIKTKRNGLNKGNYFGIIHCTDDHKIYTTNRGYVEAKDLALTDKVLNIRQNLDLTPVQKQILIGKMLGDGTLVIKENAIINTAHVGWGQKEKEYTEWCLTGLQGIANKKVDEIVSGFGTLMYRSRTINLPSIYEEFSNWLINGKKEVPDNIKLTPISMAFWYMDDGSLAHNLGQEDRVAFATNGFSITSCERLVKALSVYDIQAKIKDFKGNIITLNAENAEKFFLLVAPYICEAKKYKLPERYRDWPSYLPKEVPNQYQPLILEEEIISIEADPKTRERYDMQTETHNFFTQGGLVHNCNIRVEYDGHRVSWSGRTDNSNLPKEIEELLQKTFGDSEVIFEQNFGDKQVMLFMECYGGKIQGGVYGGPERLIGFDVMINGMYLDKRCIASIFEYFNVETVEFFEIESLIKLIDMVKNNIKSGVKDMSDHATEDRPTEKEGYVCVPAVRLLNAKGERIIVKVKYRDLAKCQEL